MANETRPNRPESKTPPPKTRNVAVDYRDAGATPGSKPTYKEVGQIQVHENNAGQAPIDAKALFTDYEKHPELEGAEIAQVYVYDPAGEPDQFPPSHQKYRASGKIPGATGFPSNDGEG